MKLRYLVLFVSIFSLFFFPTLLYAQSSTPWSFYNNPSQSNAMDIFYNGIGAANPAVRITTGGNVGIGATSPGQKLQVGKASGGASEGVIRTSTNNNAGSSREWDFGAGQAAFGNYGFNIKDTGMSAPAFNIAFSTGFVGIGTSAPAGPLDVKIATNKHIGFVNWNNMPTLAAFNDGLAAWDSLVIAPVGNVGLGTATPGYKLDVNGSTNISGNLTLSGTFSPTNLAVSGTLTAANGGFNLNNSGTSRFNEIKAKMWSAGTTSVCYGINEAVGSVTISTIGGCSSDRRLKKNIRYFEGSFLSRVNQLKPALFDLKDNSKKDVAGFIAQDVQEVFPETVYDKGADQMLEFSPNNLIPHLTKAIQELSEKVDQQQAEIEQLKKQLK